MRRDAAKPARSLGYVRISAGDADADSLDAQREAIARHCAERGHPAPAVRLEVESAGEEKLERRVELARLIREARPGDLIVVAALDRWSRDLVYGVQSVRALVRAGVGWYAVREQIDATTPEGDSNLGLRMWLAEEERKRIRGRTVGARERLRGQGLWANGSVPYGYVRGDREKREHLLLSAQEERAAIVVAWHERLARGASLRSTAQWLAQYPEAPHVVSGLHRISTGRIYLGEMRSGDAWIPGRHPALITLDLWERVQAALRERHTAGRQPRADAHADLLLAPVLRCALCGHRCGVARGRDSALRYYVCSVRRHPALYPALPACAGPWVRTDAADAAATTALLARLGELRDVLAGEAAASSPGPDTAAARERIEANLARAVQMAVDGAITAAELAVTRARLDAQRAALASREAAADRAERARTPESRRAVLRALRHLADRWRLLTHAERRQALRLLAAGVAVEADGSLRWTWRSAEDLAAEG